MSYSILGPGGGKKDGKAHHLTGTPNVLTIQSEG